MIKHIITIISILPVMFFIILLLLPRDVEAGNNLLPKEERQKLITARAMKEAEARRERIEERKKQALQPQVIYYPPSVIYYYPVPVHGHFTHCGCHICIQRMVMYRWQLNPQQFFFFQVRF